MRQPKEQRKRCSRCKELKTDVHKVRDRKVKQRYPQLCGECIVPAFAEAVGAD